VLLTLSTALAAETDTTLSSGEFRNTADTIPKGDVLIHPLFMPGGVGVAETVDIKFPGILAAVAGPMIGVEFTPVTNDSLALSIEPSFRSGWGLRTWAVGADAHLTLRLDANRLNFSLGAYQSRFATPGFEGDFVYSNYVGIPVNIGFDHVASERTVYRVTVATDARTFETGPYMGFGANWNHGSKKGNFRLSLGVLLGVGPNPLSDTLATLDEELVDTLPGFLTASTLVLPGPSIEMWWRL